MEEAAAMDVDQSDGAGSGGESVADGVEDISMETPKKKRKSPAIPWKKPPDMPKRPLSSYNLFFASERRRLLESGADRFMDDSLSHDDSEMSGSVDSARVKSPAKSTKMSFSNLAKTVAAKWKTLSVDERAEFEAQAAIEKQRYDVAVAEWRAKNKKVKEASSEDKPIDHLAALVSTMPKNTLSPTLVERDNLHMLGESWDGQASFNAGREVAQPRFGQEISRAADAGTRFQSSSSSLWASHNSLDPSELGSDEGHASSNDPYYWDHTSTTAGSSTFDLAGFSPVAHQVRRLPMDNEHDRMTNRNVPVILENRVSGESARLHRSASLPLGVPIRPFPALPQYTGYHRSFSAGMRFINEYHPGQTRRVDLDLPAHRPASVSEALPPPPFRLHRTEIAADHFDGAIRRRHSVGAQLGDTSSYHGRFVHDATSEIMPLSMSMPNDPGQRSIAEHDINNLRRTLDNDMLDFLTDMSFPDLDDPQNHPDNSTS